MEASSQDEKRARNVFSPSISPLRSKMRFPVARAAATASVLFVNQSRVPWTIWNEAGGAFPAARVTRPVRTAPVSLEETKHEKAASASPDNETGVAHSGNSRTVHPVVDSTSARIAPPDPETHCVFCGKETVWKNVFSQRRESLPAPLRVSIAIR